MNVPREAASGRRRLARGTGGSAAALLFAAALTCGFGPALAQPQRALPLAVEKNPPGDIPDSQVFVTFRSDQGYSIKAPEGWARRDRPGGVSFSDKYNALDLEVGARAVAPTLASVRAQEVAALEHGAGAVHVLGVARRALPAGPAIVVVYQVNSAPNAVTGKSIRLENERLFIWKDGRLATLTLSAPAGADNADQWRLMTRSFAWRP
jgi:hypothetical protein